MTRRLRHGALLGILICAIGASVGAPSAGAEAGDPIFQYFGSESKDGGAFKPFPPGNGFEGPCGLAVDSQADFYVADYYHHVVDVISSSRHYLTQLSDPNLSPGPCGLAVGAGGVLYVDDFHGAVVRYSPSSYPPTATTTYGSGIVIDPGPSTGVAVDPVSGRVYVDDRDRIAVYEVSGAPVESEGAPLEIGVGSLVNGYGIVVGEAAGEARLYVADAGSDTIKVFEPAVDAVDPVAEFDGAETPSGAFSSLRDSALAVDRQSGQLYLSDLLQPTGYERPEAAVYAFEATGQYLGRLKRKVVDALPPGLAIDNSPTSTRGRVYVTTGNGEGASVFAYRPGEASKSPPVCAPEGPCPEAGGASLAPPFPAVTPDSPPVGTPSFDVSPAKTTSGPWAIAQKGNLRIKVSASLAPRRLPRHGLAPVAVSIAGSVSTTDGSEPPQLTRMQIELNRHGVIEPKGLPTCAYSRIRFASTKRALSACRSALVGRGTFNANIVLSGQQPYPAEGKLLVFNGVRHGKPVLFGHIYAPHPFATSFVIVFAISRAARGAYDAVLTATPPKALGNWGYLTGIQMRISRRFSYQGKQRSYISAGCPAPKGFAEVAFPLARTSFDFAGADRLAATVGGTCVPRG